MGLHLTCIIIVQEKNCFKQNIKKNHVWLKLLFKNAVVAKVRQNDVFLLSLNKLCYISQQKKRCYNKIFCINFTKCQTWYSINGQLMIFFLLKVHFLYLGKVETLTSCNRKKLKKHILTRYLSSLVGHFFIHIFCNFVIY